MFSIVGLVGEGRYAGRGGIGFGRGKNGENEYESNEIFMVY